MSAWIVGEDHIDMLTTALLNPLINTTPAQMDANELGHMLWAENHASVNYRYNEHTRVPGYAFRPVPELATTELEPSHLVILDRQRRCYEYQTCEHPEWETSTARALMGSLQAGITRILSHTWRQVPSPYDRDSTDWAGAHAAPWGWSREDGMPIYTLREAGRA